MSTGFRLLLLIVAVFAAVWLSKRSADDIAFWLRAPRAVERELDQLESSEVDEIVPPVVRVDLLTPEVSPRVPERPPPGPRRGSAYPSAPDLESALQETAEGPPDRIEYGGAPDDEEKSSVWLDPGFEGEWQDGEPLYLGDVEESEHVAGAESQGDGGSDDPDSPDPERPSSGELEGEAGAETSEGSPDPDAEAVRTYTVRQDDTLSEIAQRLLGSVSRLPELRELNADLLRDKRFIYEGMVLEIPPR